MSRGWHGDASIWWLSPNSNVTARWVWLVSADSGRMNFGMPQQGPQRNALINGTGHTRTDTLSKGLRPYIGVAFGVCTLYSPHVAMNFGVCPFPRHSSQAGFGGCKVPLKKPKQDTEACNCKEELTQDPTDLAWYCESRLSSAFCSCQIVVCWLTEASGDEAGLFRLGSALSGLPHCSRKPAHRYEGLVRFLLDFARSVCGFHQRPTMLCWKKELQEVRRRL